jgi:hypothetical protein
MAAIPSESPTTSGGELHTIGEDTSEGGLPTEAMVADLVVTKQADHLSLYRLDGFSGILQVDGYAVHKVHKSGPRRHGLARR